MAARCTNVPTALSQRLRKSAKRSPPVPPTSHGQPRLSAPVVLAQIALSQMGARFAMTYSEVQLKIVAENARSMLNSLAGVPETVSLREDFLKQRDIMIAAAAEAQYSAMVLGATGTWADRLEEEVAPHAQGVAVALAAPSCRQCLPVSCRCHRTCGKCGRSEQAWLTDPHQPPVPARTSAAH